MRKLALAMTTAAALLLGGCATPGGGPAPSPSPTPGAVISEAQAEAVKICGYLATIATITDIFLSGNHLYSTAEDIGQAICAEVTPARLAAKQGRKRAAVPMVGHVVVHGYFVR